MAYSLTPAATTIVEGNTTITLTITRTVSFPAETIFASTLVGTASSAAGDYQGRLNLPVVFASGQAATFTVTVNEDTLVEATEQFRVMIAHLTTDGSAQALDISDITDKDPQLADPSRRAQCAVEKRCHGARQRSLWHSRHVPSRTGVPRHVCGLRGQHAIEFQEQVRGSP